MGPRQLAQEPLSSIRRNAMKRTEQRSPLHCVLVAGFSVSCHNNETILGGSWVVISGVINPLTILITLLRGNITPLITTHEPPSIIYYRSPQLKSNPLRTQFIGYGIGCPTYTSTATDGAGPPRPVHSANILHISLVEDALVEPLYNENI